MNARGCGTRKPGGLYLCCGTSPDGQPVEHFLIDPAVPLDVEPFRTPRLFEKNGLNHALVYIGEEFYSSVPKFIDETRMMGVSRRIPANFPIDKLREGSTMMMVHRRAVLSDCDKYKEVLETCKLRVVDWWCPKGRAEHRNPPEPPARIEQCLGTLWPLSNELVDVCAPFDYRTGVFAAFPITHIDYVKVPGQDGVPRDIAARAQGTDLHLNAVEE
ncbi:MAG: hypothetical protein WC455_13375 [Dehalococcoidia bacterium]